MMIAYESSYNFFLAASNFLLAYNPLRCSIMNTEQFFVFFDYKPLLVVYNVAFIQWFASKASAIGSSVC